MRFAHPVLLVLFAVLPWLWRAGASTGGAGGRGGTLWRMLAAACLILSAAGIEVATRHAAIETMAVVDVSASVPPLLQRLALGRINAIASTMHQGDRLGIVAFGADAAIEMRPRSSVRVPALVSTIANTATNIAAGLEAAQLALPGNGARRIVLFSDGRETNGRAERAATAAGAAGIPVDVVIPDFRGVWRRPAVTHVVAPAEVRRDEPFLVSVEIDGAPGAQGRVVIRRDGQPILSRTVTIAPDGTASVAITETHHDAGARAYMASVGPEQPIADDIEPADAGAGAIVSVEGEQAVLYVSDALGQLQGLLSSSGFRVTQVRPGSLPTRPEALRAFNLVVLDDVRADEASTAQLTTLSRFVRKSGGGLLLLGSSRTLDVSGYPAGPLGSILPVDLRPRGGRRAPASGLVLVVDKSGSMGDLSDGLPKIELARQAVMRVREVLPPADWLGLIAFDATPVAVAPLSLVATTDPEALATRLNAIQPGGATQIAPAVELAVRWLQHASGVEPSRRHVLLVTDGRTSAADVDRLRAALGATGTRLSAVATGVDADHELLRRLAESSGGHVYVPTDARDLPAIVAREASRSASGTTVEEPFQVRSAPHPIVAGIERTSMPVMAGYVVGVSKPTAFSVLTSHLDDPILSVWRAGLGRVAVFTADLGSRGSAALRQWNAENRLWAQAARWLSKPAEDHGLQMAFTESETGIRLSLEAERPDGTLVTLTDARALVRSPRGETSDLALTWSAPGRYEASVPTMATGAYVVAFAGRDGQSGADVRTVRGFYWSADRERRFRDADTAFLRRLAELTGGRVLEAADSPFDGARPWSYTAIWRWTATAGLVVFVLGLALQHSFDARKAFARVRAPRWPHRRSAAA